MDHTLHQLLAIMGSKRAAGTSATTQQTHRGPGERPDGYSH